MREAVVDRINGHNEPRYAARISFQVCEDRVRIERLGNIFFINFSSSRKANTLTRIVSILRFGDRWCLVARAHNQPFRFFPLRI